MTAQEFRDQLVALSDGHDHYARSNLDELIRLVRAEAPSDAEVGQALREVQEALPEGWWLHYGLGRDGDGQPQWVATATNFDTFDLPDERVGKGPTIASAESQDGKD